MGKGTNPITNNSDFQEIKKTVIASLSAFYGLFMIFRVPGAVVEPT